MKVKDAQKLIRKSALKHKVDLSKVDFSFIDRQWMPHVRSIVVKSFTREEEIYLPKWKLKICEWLQIPVQKKYIYILNFSLTQGQRELKVLDIISIKDITMGIVAIVNNIVLAKSLTPRPYLYKNTADFGTELTIIGTRFFG